MPFGLLRYALARRYPARPDLPAPRDLKPTYDVVVIGGGSDPYPLHATRTTLDYKESLIAHCLEMFPGLGEVRLMREWAGITDITPDYSPIMSATPLANYYVDAGTGTWGFKATLAAGRYMAELIATGRTPDMLVPFRLDRFDTYDLTNEAGATAAGH